MGFRGIIGLALMTALAGRGLASAGERSVAQRVGYATYAALANVVPVVSAFVEPRCLVGYVLCKASFAAFSLVAAGEHLFMAGDAGTDARKVILRRGFGGDWFVRTEHVTGERIIDVLPEAPDVGAALSEAPVDGS